MNEKQTFFNYCVIDKHIAFPSGDMTLNFLFEFRQKRQLSFVRQRTKKQYRFSVWQQLLHLMFGPDVQRELSGNNDKHRLKEDSVIRFDTFKQKGIELWDYWCQLQTLLRMMMIGSWKKKLGTSKQIKLINHLSKFPFDKSNDYGK